MRKNERVVAVWVSQGGGGELNRLLQPPTNPSKTVTFRMKALLLCLSVLSCAAQTVVDPGQWAWVTGSVSNSIQQGSFGTINVANTANVPPALARMCIAVSSTTGLVYVYGGLDCTCFVLGLVLLILLF
jgi:hypothetical protein